MRRVVPLLVALAPSAAFAEEPMQVTAASSPPHVAPRAKASYRLFSIGGLDGNRLWMNGAQLDVYAMSRRWVRLGVELEGGGGGTELGGTPVRLAYGLFGLQGGVQYPARVTPFLDGRAVGGILHAQLDGPVTALGKTLPAGDATTYVYGGGIETGVELYAYKRFFVSGAIGWVRTTWRGPDAEAMLANPTGGFRSKDLVNDSFTCKIGFGL
jgi:hypothetical protein